VSLSLRKDRGSDCDLQESSGQRDQICKVIMDNAISVEFDNNLMRRGVDRNLVSVMTGEGGLAQDEIQEVAHDSEKKCTASECSVEGAVRFSEDSDSDQKRKKSASKPRGIASLIEEKHEGSKLMETENQRPVDGIWSSEFLLYPICGESLRPVCLSLACKTTRSDQTTHTAPQETNQIPPDAVTNAGILEKSQRQGLGLVKFGAQEFTGIQTETKIDIARVSVENLSLKSCTEITR
jgi:hypothetical protein